MNNTTVSIKVTYFSKKLGEFAKKSYVSDIKFKEIIDYYKNNIQSSKPNTKLKSSYCYNDKEILDSTNITDLITINEDVKILEIKIHVKVDDITSMSTRNPTTNISLTNKFYTKILKPKSNPFRLLIYSTNDNKISTQNIPENFLNLSSIFKFNEIDSAFCNSYENLYVSGGTYNNQILDDFWIINNKSFEIQSIKMPIPKKNHSMLYIDLLKCVIIVGGSDKKCLLFDIKNKNFINLPELDDVYLEPALCFLDNYLYCLNSFDKNKKFFERIYLSNDYNSKLIKWEKLYPKNYFSYNNKLFGVAKFDDNIILACGEKTQRNTLLFETKNNLINKSKGKDQNCILDDKTFYKINENYGIAFPKKFSIEKGTINYIMLINFIKNEVQKVFFDMNKKIRFDFFKKEDIENDENIKIETKVIKKKDKDSNNVSLFESSHITKISPSVSPRDSNKINNHKNNITNVSIKKVTENNNINSKNNYNLLIEKNRENNKEKNEANNKKVIYTASWKLDRINKNNRIEQNKNINNDIIKEEITPLPEENSQKGVKKIENNFSSTITSSKNKNIYINCDEYNNNYPINLEENKYNSNDNGVSLPNYESNNSNEVEEEEIIIKDDIIQNKNIVKTYQKKMIKPLHNYNSNNNYYYNSNYNNYNYVNSNNYNNLKNNTNNNFNNNYDNNYNRNGASRFCNVNNGYKYINDYIKEESFEGNSAENDEIKFENENLIICESNQDNNLYDPYSIIKTTKKSSKSIFYLPKKYYDNELIKQEINLNNKLEQESTIPIIRKEKTKIKESEEILNFESIPENENIFHNKVFKKKVIFYVNKNIYDSQLINKQIINNTILNNETLLNENSTIDRRFKNEEDGYETDKLIIGLLDSNIIDTPLKQSIDKTICRNLNNNNNQLNNNNNIFFNSIFSNVSEIKEESIPRNITSNTTLKELKINPENKKIPTGENLKSKPKKKLREIVIRNYCIEPPRELIKSNRSSRKFYNNKETSVHDPELKVFNRPCTPQNNSNKYYNNSNDIYNNIDENKIKNMEKKERSKGKIFVPNKHNSPSKIRIYLQNEKNCFSYRGNSINYKNEDGNDICNILSINNNNVNIGNKGNNIYVKKILSKNKY